MQPLITKRVRGTAGHDARIVQWAEKTRSHWLGTHADWSSYPTVNFAIEFSLCFFGWLLRVGFWLVGQFCRHRFVVLCSLSLPLIILGVTLRQRTTDGLTLLNRFENFNAERSSYRRSSHYFRLNPLPSPPTHMASYCTLEEYSLDQLAETHKELLQTWRAGHRNLIVSDYRLPSPSGVTPWDWSRQLILHLSWQEGACTTLKNCRVHHTEIADSGVVGHFSGINNWRERTRTSVRGTQWNRLLTLLGQFPPTAEACIPEEHALIVSYQDGEKWEVRLYDRRQLPVSLISLGRLIHENYIQ